MKLKFYLAGIIIAGVAGYFVEPKIRGQLVNPTPAAAKIPALPAVAVELPKPVAEASPAALTDIALMPEPAADVVAIEPEVVVPAEPELPVAGPEPVVVASVLPEVIPEFVPTGTAAEIAIIKAMQANLKAGRVNEFKYSQVSEWKAGPDITVAGEAYQTGLAAYKAKTAFGEKKIQVKAILKANSVVRWIWPKSGIEIH
jgi:hypothetical protein